MIGPSDRSLPTKRKRRWFQYSLRTLLIVMTVFALWLGYRVKRAREQRAAVEAVLDLGGSLVYAHQVAGGKFDPKSQPPGPAWLRAFMGDEYFQRVVEVRLIDKNVGEEALKHIGTLRTLRLLSFHECRLAESGVKHIGDLSDLESLALNFTNVSDEGVSHLGQLKRLEYLGLAETEITDTGLRHVQSLSNLEILILQSTRVGDAGVSGLSALKRLHTLNLGSTLITDESLSHLRHSGKLTFLFLDNTRVGDAGIASLATLASLRELHLRATQVSPHGVRQFQQAAPQCSTIEYEMADLSNKPLNDATLESVFEEEGPDLKLLDLSNTSITDAQLVYLEEFTGLQFIDLRGTPITDAGVERLRKVLPDCTIQR